VLRIACLQHLCTTHHTNATPPPPPRAQATAAAPPPKLDPLAPEEKSGNTKQERGGADETALIAAIRGNVSDARVAVILRDGRECAQAPLPVCMPAALPLPP